MYTWKIWDKTSSINGVDAQKVLTSLGNPTEIYLINDGGQTLLIQTDRERPYRDLLLAECAQKQVDDMNYLEQVAELTMQVYTGKIPLEDVPAELKQGVFDGIAGIRAGLNPPE